MAPGNQQSLGCEDCERSKRQNCAADDPHRNAINLSFGQRPIVFAAPIVAPSRGGHRSSAGGGRPTIPFFQPTAPRFE
ncbi:hypothetical protein TNIN_82451 [Trichonephila inaurata madagascariensis]|uniref:Uncharacterized protein n=1 Tax=Trichonephila inaurata madagascariensis TaxID=2747483 RepID=A0A8X6XTY0_9ARAC|nr:hypothetical protein TNIN_82451 [Trichonephila inaurata madagascariensis]